MWQKNLTSCRTAQATSFAHSIENTGSFDKVCSLLAAASWGAWVWN